MAGGKDAMRGRKIALRPILCADQMQPGQSAILDVEIGDAGLERYSPPSASIVSRMEMTIVTRRNVPI
jgi:hypothetical protein